tara:strand:- start:87 stop:614 length:528 start_codon:yes stop_codon:yes gene_type:complete
MADKQSQKKGAIKPSTTLSTNPKKGINNPTVGLSDKLLAVETQAVKSYGVYNSKDYADWRKQNNFSSIDSSNVAKQASKLQKDLKSKDVSMADVKKVNSFLKKYHSPLTALDKKEREEYNKTQEKLKKREKLLAPISRKTKVKQSKGGLTKSRTGPQDFRKGGMVLSTVDNRKNK